MSDLTLITDASAARGPEMIALGPDAPSLAALFTFMRDAEQRFETLRMRLLDGVINAAGERVEASDLWMRHPGRAKIVRGAPGAGTAAPFRVWLSDGTTIRTYDSAANIATVRPAHGALEGAADPDLPAFSRVRAPRTRLPMESLAETFVHPHSFCTNVLRSGPTRILGTARLTHGRVAFVLRADHPRVSHVLTDRPDRWLEVGVDRMTGLILLLVEHIGDRVTRRAEVVDLELDGRMGDEVFEIHLSSDVRTLY